MGTHPASHPRLGPLPSPIHGTFSSGSTWPSISGYPVHSFPVPYASMMPSACPPHMPHLDVMPAPWGMHPAAMGQLDKQYASAMLSHGMPPAPPTMHAASSWDHVYAACGGYALGSS